MMLKAQNNKTTGLLALAFVLPLTLATGCVSEWHEGNDWGHNEPDEGECDDDERWDPILCECVELPEHDEPEGECDADERWDPVACECVDANPNNPNHPNNPNNPTTCPDDMTSLYLSRDAAACSGIDFQCPAEYESFVLADCGCGCEATAPVMDVCPDEADPAVFFVSREAKVCTTVSYTCPEGHEAFLADCGCGCVELPPEPTCPDANDPMVHYLGDDPSVCSVITFSCPDDCVEFNNECGCGCIEPS